jgi:hypothetical protein
VQHEDNNTLTSSLFAYLLFGGDSGRGQRLAIPRPTTPIPRWPSPARPACLRSFRRCDTILYIPHSSHIVIIDRQAAGRELDGRSSFQTVATTSLALRIFIIKIIVFRGYKKGSELRQ